MWLSDLPGTGYAEQQYVMLRNTPNKVTLNLDGELQVIRPRTFGACCRNAARISWWLHRKAIGLPS